MSPATISTAAPTSPRSIGRRRRLSAYPRTAASESALDILARSYDKLGLVQLRDDTLAILRKTFPDSIYLAGPVEKPWWRLW